MWESNDRFQYLVELAYLGSDFYGVQDQPNLRTVLGALRERIFKASSQKARGLFVSARTDRGVHALHNCMTFYLNDAPPPSFVKSMREHRDDGLLALKIMRVDKKVHARGCATGKVYRYTVVDETPWSQEIINPFAFSIEPELDVDRMRKAAHHFLGSRDFSSLRGGGCEAKTTIKQLFSIDIKRCGSAISIDVFGESFLRKMIRNLVGLLIEVGVGLRDPDTMPEILDAKNRERAGITAPAHGLILMKVCFTRPSEVG